MDQIRRNGLHGEQIEATADPVSGYAVHVVDDRLWFAGAEADDVLDYDRRLYVQSRRLNRETAVKLALRAGILIGERSKRRRRD